MGYYTDKLQRWTTAGMDRLLKEGNIFTMSSGAAVLANNGTVAMKLYASATMYPQGVRLIANLDADGGPWSIGVSTYTTFTFSSYAATTSWRYPDNMDIRSSSTLTSFTMTTSTKASTAAVIRLAYVSGRNEHNDFDVILNPAVGYRFMATNLSGANRIYGLTVTAIDMADDKQ